jgi:hypothetical protein
MLIKYKIQIDLSEINKNISIQTALKLSYFQYNNLFIYNSFIQIKLLK